MAYNPVTVANYIIGLAAKADKKLTPMQLNKLTYIAHGFSLGRERRPLINEPVEAWRYGPVIPSLYRRLKRYGSSHVDSPVTSFFRGDQSEGMWPEDKALIEAVFEKYGHLTGAQLSFLTHKKGTPWDRAYQPDIYGIEIPDAQIGQHYADLLNAGN
ncbi:Panacea domain-containing protein [Novosphingobium sp. KN65.2]|uniref:Panacea domain-containing protein n=1 Tax=Novosphingobium sp. KN65.2 TaxID=1478134 RepID=UPI0005E76966